MQSVQPMQLFVTGATGMIGSHVVEVARQRSCQVRALVRQPLRGLSHELSGHDLNSTQHPEGLLKAWGAQIVRGDLADAGIQESLLPAALQGIDAVIHCAAKVGDSGSIDDYYAINVEATRKLLDAALASKSCRRFIHISSLGVYPARHHHGTDESTTINLNGLDPYTRTKAEAEELVRSYRARGLGVVILRPGFVYGPRDRHVLPALDLALGEQRFRYLGRGERLLDNTGVRNAVEAIFLALYAERALGQTYNITDARLVTRREFIDTVACGLSLQAPDLQVPEWAARLLLRFPWSRELSGLSYARFKFLALHLQYSIAKAQQDLGYSPLYDFQDGMQEALAWYRMHKTHAKHVVKKAG